MERVDRARGRKRRLSEGKEEKQERRKKEGRKRWLSDKRERE